MRSIGFRYCRGSSWSCLGFSELLKTHWGFPTQSKTLPLAGYITTTMLRILKWLDFVFLSRNTNRAETEAQRLSSVHKETKKTSGERNPSSLKHLVLCSVTLACPPSVPCYILKYWVQHNMTQSVGPSVYMCVCRSSGARVLRNTERS